MKRTGSPIDAFAVALRGLASMLRTQRHARVHLAASIAVIMAGIILNVSLAEWIALIIVMGLVWMAEAFNTAIETLGDAVTQDYHPLIGRAKDVAAGAVLLAAITATLVGMLIFIPKVLPDTSRDQSTIEFRP